MHFTKQLVTSHFRLTENIVYDFCDTLTVLHRQRISPHTITEPDLGKMDKSATVGGHTQPKIPILHSPANHVLVVFPNFFPQVLLLEGAGIDEVHPDQR